MKIKFLHTYSKTIIAVILLSVVMISCGTNRRTTTRNTSIRTTQSSKIENITNVSLPSDHHTETPSDNNSVKPSFSNPVEAYIWEYTAIAQEEMRLYGVPASITIAQGILESGAGNGNLTLRSNNHFGIKCNGWEGAKVYHDDDELQECFRKYNDPKYSFRDHSLFLYERPRYAFLFDYETTDYKSWAEGLRKAGYATDRKYPDKLISLIERYHLHELDEQVVNGTPPPHFSKPIKNISSNPSIYVVSAGDTLFKIASKFNLTVEELKEYNQLKSDTIYAGQKLKLKSLRN